MTHTAPALKMREALILLGVLAGLILLTFFETTGSMVAVWIRSRTFNHGFLILPIVLYLVWLRRDSLAALAPEPSPLGLVWLAGAGALWFAGELAQANVVQHFSLVLMLQGAVLTIFGLAFARALLFPLAYLLFMVPFGDFAVEPLQALTAHYTTILVRLSGVPIYLENWIMVIPGGSFLVAEACSGVRFLIATIALGAMASNMFFERWWKRGVFMLLAFLVPVIANVLRAWGIVMIAWWSDFELAVGIDHIVYGFIFLSFVLFVMTAIAWWMRDPMPAAPAPATPPPGAAPASTVSMMAAGGAALLLLVAVRLFGDFVNAPHDSAPVRLVAPALGGGWQAGDPGVAWRASYPRADADRQWTLSRGEETFHLHVAWYADEYRGKELISFENSLAGPAGSPPIEAGVLRNWPLSDAPAPAYLMLDGRQGIRVVWYWYWIDGHITGRSRDAKLASMLGKLQGGETPAAVIAIAGGEELMTGAALAGLLTDSGLDALLGADGPASLVEPAGKQ